MYITVRERSYWVEDEGTGPVLCFLHGFTGSTSIWKEVRKSFPEFRLVLIDLPGHGKTGDLGPVSMEKAVHDLEMIFQRLEVTRVSLLGYSMGGRTALCFAERFPHLIDRLILESASPGLSSREEREERIRKDKKVIALLQNSGIEGFTDKWESLPLFETIASLPGHRQQKLREERLDNDIDGLVHSLEGMGTGVQPSMWDSLSFLMFPVCLIAGGEDKKYVAINERMAGRFPDAQLCVIEGAGHIPHLEKPEIFSEITRSFVI